MSKPPSSKLPIPGSKPKLQGSKVQGSRVQAPKLQGSRVQAPKLQGSQVQASKLSGPLLVQALNVQIQKTKTLPKPYQNPPKTYLDLNPI